MDILTSLKNSPIFILSNMNSSLGNTIKGIICRIESKDFYVFPDDSDKTIRCTLRGKFKKEFHLKKDKLFHTDIAVVGDYVQFQLNEDGTGVIHTVEKRKNYLSRKAPRIRGASYRGERLEQIIASNIDNIFIVSSVLKPSFNNKVVDRLLVLGESAKMNTHIIINKIDLDENSANYWYEFYKNVGYKVFLTSALSGEGVDLIKMYISEKKNIFIGQSGAGKSSLLNKISPNLFLKVGTISPFTDKGIHTTVTSILLKIEKNTFIIDTPGIREIDPFGIRKEDLGYYFKEFPIYLKNCKFNTCTHKHEPDCAVIKAVNEGKISVERYESYLRMLETVEEDILF